MKKKNKKSKIPVSLIAKGVIGLFALFLFFVFGQKTVNAIKNSEYFKIKRITLHPSLKFIDSRELDRLIGRNLFSVNLPYVQSVLQKRYPKISKLRILRRFPDQIYVMAKKRLPYAYIQLQNGKRLVIDEEQTVLPSEESYGFTLPIIEGVAGEDHIAEGERLRNRNVRIAFSIIRSFHEQPGLSDRSIKRINADSLSKIHLYLDDDLNIIINKDDITRKMDLLSLLLSQGKIDANSTKYIDLRFSEPVLGTDN